MHFARQLHCKRNTSPSSRLPTLDMDFTAICYCPKATMQHQTQVLPIIYWLTAVVHAQVHTSQDITWPLPACYQTLAVTAGTAHMQVQRGEMSRFSSLTYNKLGHIQVLTAVRFYLVVKTIEINSSTYRYQQHSLCAIIAERFSFRLTILTLQWRLSSKTLLQNHNQNIN